MMDERFPLDHGQDMTNHQENCTRTSSEVSFCPVAIQDGLFTYFFSPAGFCRSSGDQQKSPFPLPRHNGYSEKILMYTFLRWA